MMRIVLNGDRVFHEIIELKIEGDRVEFLYYPEDYSDPLTMVTSKECIQTLEYVFILDE